MVVGEAGSGVTVYAWVIISALAMSHRLRIVCGILLAVHVLGAIYLAKALFELLAILTSLRLQTRYTLPGNMRTNDVRSPARRNEGWCGSVRGP